jgi:hypothetical protein
VKDQNVTAVTSKPDLKEEELGEYYCKVVYTCLVIDFTYIPKGLSDSTSYISEIISLSLLKINSVRA